VDWNDGLGGFYPVVAASTGGSSGFGYNLITGAFGTGGTDIQTGKAGDQSANPSPEGNFNFATTWFPYAQGWVGAAVDNPDTEGNPRFASENSHSPGLNTNIVSWPEIDGTRGGSALLTLPGVNANQDGMLFATSTQGGSDVKLISVAPAFDGSGWFVTARGASQNDPTTLATGNAQFQVVYIPYSAGRLIGGEVAPNGSLVKSNGQFTLGRASAGTYNLAIPGKTGTNGVLLLQSIGFLQGSTNIANPNFLSYQYNDAGSGTNGLFAIQARHTEAGNTFPLTDSGFYFAWVDFSTPLTPPVTTATTPPTLSIAKSGSTAVLSWSANANGFTLEHSPALGSQANWLGLGVVGEGSLVNSYTIPAGTNTEFYRLRK
jgi:hypothetical protein